MTEDVECPYCGKWQEINHDDGYGYEEGKIFTQECRDCEKTFTYTTSISYYYDAEKAPCQNGAPHDFQSINGFPKEIFVGKSRCVWCNELHIDEEKNKKSVQEYFKKLDREKTKK